METDRKKFTLSIVKEILLDLKNETNRFQKEEFINWLIDEYNYKYVVKEAMIDEIENELDSAIYRIKNILRSK